MSLEDLSKERPESGVLYEHARQRDAAKSEETLATFFRSVIRPPAEKPSFRQSFAFAPAKFIVEYLPDDVAVPILERMKRSFRVPNMPPSDRQWTSPSWNAMPSAKGTRLRLPSWVEQAFVEIAGKDLEEAVFGVSSRLLQEGKPYVALTMCSNFFGSVESAVPKYCTNSIYFNHLAALESALGNAGRHHTHLRVHADKPPSRLR